jgi:phosphoglycerol transferase MdoB-like AlkP superfamily enzyme
MKAVHHVDFDLGRLVGRLKEEGLFTRETLLVVTADHSCPPNSVTRQIPGHTRQPLGSIPFVILTPQELPEFHNDVATSQIDIAPTLFHLLDLPIPQGWWGDSLFAKKRTSPPIGFNRNMVTLGRGKDRVLFNMSKKSEAAREFDRVFSTVYVER